MRRIVSVMRIAPQFRDIEVEVEDVLVGKASERALDMLFEKRALEAAHDLDFTGCSKEASYQVTNQQTMIPEVEDVASDNDRG